MPAALAAGAQQRGGEQDGQSQGLCWSGAIASHAWAAIAAVCVSGRERVSAKTMARHSAMPASSSQSEVIKQGIARGFGGGFSGGRGPSLGPSLGPSTWPQSFGRGRSGGVGPAGGHSTLIIAVSIMSKAAANPG